MNNILAGKIILVTGGTGELGRALVEKTALAGARVFFTYRENSAAAYKLQALGASGFQSDFSDPFSIEDFLRCFRERTDRLDVLIHNAAAVKDSPLLDMDEKAWDYVLNVNLKAPFYLTRELLPLLFKAGAAKIFMLTSRMAYLGGRAASNYAAAKAGLIGLVKSLARELGPQGVLVNAVNPGFMISGMTRDIPQRVREMHRNESPLGIFSDPGEVAEFLTGLCSDRMKQVTGQIFNFESRNIPWM